MRASGKSLVPAIPLTVAMLFATGGVPALAADAADGEAGMCRTISISEIAEMTGQDYEDAPFWDLDEDCKYLATSDPDGFHYVRLHLDGLYPYERYREGSLDPVDLEIEGRPAFAVSDDDPRGWLNTQVAVDLGDVTLRTTIIADEGADPDQLDNTVHIAENAVANLDYEPAPPEAPAAADDVSLSADIPRIELPLVDGIQWWEDDIEGYAAGVAELVEAGLNLPFEVLLDGLGADIAQLGFRTAPIRDSNADTVGAYVAVRVVGVDSADLEVAALAWLAELLGASEAPAEPIALGGRDVLQVPMSPEEQAYLYVEGDTVHLLSVSEAVAARILEVLP